MKPTDDGIPTLVSLTEAARVLGFSEIAVIGWADRRSLAFHQLEPRGKRYVHRNEMQRIADRTGITLNWLAILE